MTFSKHIKHLVTVLVLASALQAADKVATTSFEVLKIVPGVAGMGMGNAYVATASDVSAIFWNPAGMTRAQGNQVYLSHVNLPADVNYEAVAFTNEVPGRFTWGLSGAMLHMDDMIVYTAENNEFGVGTGEKFTASDLVVSGGFGLPVTDRLCFGGTVRFLRSNWAGYLRQSYSFDVGLTYLTGLRNIMLGMTMLNLGPDASFDGSFTSYVDQPLGVDKGFGKYQLPVNIMIGLSGDLEQMMDKDIENFSGTLSMQLDHPSDEVERMSFGVETWLSEVLALRGGYKFTYEEEPLTDNFTAGISLKTAIGANVIQLDAAWANMGPLNDYSSAMNTPLRFGLTFKL